MSHVLQFRVTITVALGAAQLRQGWNRQQHHRCSCRRARSWQVSVCPRVIIGARPVLGGDAAVATNHGSVERLPDRLRLRSQWRGLGYQGRLRPHAICFTSIDPALGGQRRAPTRQVSDRQSARRPSWRTWVCPPGVTRLVEGGRIRTGGGAQLGAWDRPTQPWCIPDGLVRRVCKQVPDFANWDVGPVPYGYFSATMAGLGASVWACRASSF